MRADHQVTSIHYVNSYAALDRVPPPLISLPPMITPKDLPLSTFLLTPEDCTALRSNYINLVARILVDKFAFFSQLKCVPSHVHHPHIYQQNTKSSIVREFIL